MLLNFHGSFVFVASRLRLQQLLQDITFKTVCQQLFYFVLCRLCFSLATACIGYHIQKHLSTTFLFSFAFMSQA